MKLIKQSYSILSVPDRLLQIIEQAGRTCYKSEDSITAVSANRFIEMLISRGHHAMIEFGDIIVKFITNRGVTHEMVRHRLCNFAQESTRYVRYDGDMEFIEPVWLEGSKAAAQAFFFAGLQEAEKVYQCLLEQKWRPEQAREVLPNALKTEIVVKANVREWRHIFKLRCSKAAHPQMRGLVTPLLYELYNLYPALFTDIVEEVEK